MVLVSNNLSSKADILLSTLVYTMLDTLIQSKTRLKLLLRFFLNPDFNTAKIPKVVGGHGAEALKLALAMYDTAIVQTVPVSDCKTAEAVKLTENIFRSVNIALVNELKVVY